MIIKHLPLNQSPGKSIAYQNRDGGTLHGSSRYYPSAATAWVLAGRKQKTSIGLLAKNKADRSSAVVIRAD
jgi:hypothetical protein